MKLRFFWRKNSFFWTRKDCKHFFGLSLYTSCYCWVFTGKGGIYTKNRNFRDLWL